MANEIYHSVLIFNLNERLFINALDGLTEVQIKERLSGHNNPISWIAAHTVWARYNTLMFLGQPAKNPFDAHFEGFKAYSDSIEYPLLETIKAEWHKASALLKEAFQAVSATQLAAESPVKSPMGDTTISGTIAFLAQHESYDIGQIAFLKKYYTGEAMKYNYCKSFFKQ